MWWLAPQRVDNMACGNSWFQYLTTSDSRHTVDQHVVVGPPRQVANLEEYSTPRFKSSVQWKGDVSEDPDMWTGLRCGW